MYGLQALSHLCEKQPSFGSKIVSGECVRIAAPLLVDSDPALRHAAAGALRNLSAISVEICENLVDQDILTPLLSLLQKHYFNTNWVPAIEKKTNQLDQNSDTFLHVSDRYFVELTRLIG
jgi:HEAT repeat-containing protein 3